MAGNNLRIGYTTTGVENETLTEAMTTTSLSFIKNALQQLSHGFIQKARSIRDTSVVWFTENR